MKNKTLRKSKIAWILTIIWIVINFVLVCSIGTSGMDLSNWGEFIGGSAGILALIWLVIGYYQQSEELRLNTDALKAQQEELKQQVEATTELAKHAERQAQAAEMQTDLSSLSQRYGK